MSRPPCDEPTVVGFGATYASDCRFAKLPCVEWPVDCGAFRGVMMSEYVVVVDENDLVQGSGEKVDVHRRAILHRAFSVIIFDEQGRMLVQRRSTSKYHCGGLLTNSCCGHPRPGEDIVAAAKRRVGEELGAELAPNPRCIGRFRYRVDLDNGMIENEIVHVFISSIVGTYNLNLDEVSNIYWMSYNDVSRKANDRPSEFTYWFREYLFNAGEISDALRLTSKCATSG